MERFKTDFVHPIEQLQNDIKKIKTRKFIKIYKKSHFQSNTILFGEKQEKSVWQLENSKFDTCYIEIGCIILNTLEIISCIIRKNAIVKGCGLIRGPVNNNNNITFGNGLEISPGLETGGRNIRLVTDCSLEQITKICMEQYRDVEAKKKYDFCIDSYLSRISFPFTILEENCIVENSSEVIDSYIGQYCHVSSNGRVRNSTLLSHCKIEQGSDVIDSILQKNVHVSTQSIVKSSFICENGSVEIQGKLLNSILGPGSQLAEGEISSSLIGPMVGFHHQSMLIATYWPSGRGNVGYGANCGSNHTSRVSDQSMWPGEGCFFGLGTCIKFPMNLIESPYSVIATGVTFGPGRLNLPFSLITQEGGGAECRIAPGWGIISNAYALERNCMKMKQRLPKVYSWDIFRRPTIANNVFQARNILLKIQAKYPQLKVYKESEEDGLFLSGGYITSVDLQKGIESYEFFLQLYCLRGISQYGLSLKKNQSSSEETSSTLQELDITETGLVVTDETYAKHTQALFTKIFPSSINFDIPKKRIELEIMFLQNIYNSKSRDHVRGRKVFPFGRYDEAIDLEKDGVIKIARERVNVLKSKM